MLLALVVAKSIDGPFVVSPAFIDTNGFCSPCLVISIPFSANDNLVLSFSIELIFFNSLAKPTSILPLVLSTLTAIFFVSYLVAKLLLSKPL